MIVFFGEPWPPPSIYQGLAEKEHRRSSTPVGLGCLRCTLPILSGDQGYVMPLLRGPVDECYWSLEPVHRECDLSERVGPLEHLGASCGCESGLFTHNARTPNERRATAMEAWRRHT